MFDKGQIVNPDGPIVERKARAMAELNEKFGGLEMLNPERPTHMVLLSKASFELMDTMIKDIKAKAGI